MARVAKRHISMRRSRPAKAKARALVCRAEHAKTAPGSKFTSRTPWRVKLEKKQERKIVAVPRKMVAQLGPGKLLIPTPLDVDEEIRRSHAGELLTTRILRARLAERFGADTTCPLCTGIFARIAAETAAEDERAGRLDVTPFWRVVGDNGELNPKFPGGVAAQAHRLLEEGHKVTLGSRGKRPRVSDRPPVQTSVGVLVCE
jgi:hypothetical protein